MSHMGNSEKADGVGNEIGKRNQDRDLVNQSLGQEVTAWWVRGRKNGISSYPKHGGDRKVWLAISPCPIHIAMPTGDWLSNLSPKKADTEAKWRDSWQKLLYRRGQPFLTT